MDYYENPDLEWYKKISAKNKVLPRCPYASVYKCPIYFRSRALLRRTNADELDKNEEEKIIKYWKNSELDLSLLEEEPTIYYGDKRQIESVTNFCPEATFYIYGYFVSFISDSGDETDRAIRYNNLKKQNIKQDSWAWNWSGLRSKHYTDCRMYSVLSNEKKIEGSKNNNITSKQLSEYKKYEYKCYDQIHIPGTSSFYRSNEIIINRNKINIGDSLFLLLLRLAVELKKGEDGWVNIYDLHNERIINNPDKHQIYSNLRTVLKGSLIDKNGKKFIENDGSRHYRISTHPDFITYNKEKLLNHKDSQIKKLAEELP